MTRKPLFWIVFVALGLAGAVTAWRTFDVALPSVSIDISMDREAALARAAELADRFEWGPQDARSAASFGQVDPEVQTYVELEGGGRDAYQGLMDANAYQPYQWRVRRFAEDEVEEVQVRFTPQGEPYGFRVRLGEADPGTGNLSDDDALAVVRQGADAWGLELAAYALIESSEETFAGGRIDHTFVFERPDVPLAEARFRVRLVVAGDRLAGLTHFVFVPEAFSRRYADMRSTNEAIALVAQGVFVLVYVLLGAGVGSALLLRRRWIEWRTALLWGGVVALLFGLNSINALPLSWMGYDTALSARTFVLQNIAAAGAVAILGAPLLAFFFLAGESLGRRAFPEHVQQWKFWRRDVAASNTALGLTVAAYVLVGLQVGYVVLFYWGTSRLEGWWSPADALVQPDLLATYMPWLQAVSISLFASFWEESIFRAVPIACAALIGARFGRRNLWVWGVVVVQALVFAAGHANYPQQPPYARVIELWLPAFVWGAVYVFYGLVPTIAAHFLYDLALISSVLFASEAWVDQGVIVAVAAVPLAVVLWARRGGRARSKPPDWAYNASWRPASDRAGVPGASARPPQDDDGEGAAGAATPNASADESRTPFGPPGRALLGLGVLGAVLWLVALSLPKLPPRLELTRHEAVAAARAELERRGFDLAGWTPSATASGARSQAHEYVFEEAGREAFDALQGEFLAPPQWIVRFVDWEAAPEERVEEHLVNLSAGGAIRRVAHTLPEGRAGAALPEDSARVLARAALPPGNWVEVGAEETALEVRTDWDFTFRDPGVLGDVDGEARAAVTVLGTEVTNVRRFVDVPEEWERAERDRASRRAIFILGLAFTLVLLFGVAAVVAVVVWSRGGLETGPLWKAAALGGVALVLSAANGWPATTTVFSTAQPYGFQAGGAAFGLVIAILVGAAAVALVVALGHSWSAPGTRSEPSAWVGVAVGFLIAGVGSIASALSGGLPSLPEYGAAGEYVPMLSAPVDTIMPFIALTGGMLTLAAAHQRLRARPALKSLPGFAILALGVVIVPTSLQESVPAWIAGSLAAAAVIRWLVGLVGRQPALAPLIFGTMVALDAVEQLVVAAYPGSVVGYGLAAIATAALARAWSKELARPAGSAAATA